MGLVELARRVWHFLWVEDSLASWIANVVLAFIIIKFLVYPGLGLLLGTSAPIVAVVSGSMEHDGSFDDFWDESMCCNRACTQSSVQGRFYEGLNLSKEKFKDFGFVNGFNKGDIMVLYSPKKAVVGDVIVYIAQSRPEPIIHRVIHAAEENGKRFFDTKGDHNCGVDETFEKRIPEERVIGKAVWRVPFLGWVKIIAVGLLQGLR